MGRIVIGSPKTVPAGQYAEESLRALGLWDRLQPKLVFAENVRQALDYVARGEVDAGFVYTTDAATRAQGVKEAFRPPDDSYRPVIYPGAVVAAAKQPALGPGLPRPAGRSAGPGRAEPLRLPAAAGRRALIAAGRSPSAGPGRSRPRVRWVGAQRDVLGGDLRGHVDLETLSSVPHLYGLGPLEGVRGEVSIFGGVPSIARIEAGDRW